MKITIESTEQIFRINGVPARLWVGQTESGADVACFITNITINEKQYIKDEFKDLEQTNKPDIE